MRQTATVVLPCGARCKLLVDQLPHLVEEGDTVRGNAAGVGLVTITVALVTDAHGHLIGYSPENDQHYTLRPRDVTTVHVGDEAPGVYDLNAFAIEAHLDDVVDELEDLEAHISDEIEPDYVGTSSVPGVTEDIADAVDALERARDKLAPPDHPQPAEAM